MGVEDCDFDEFADLMLPFMKPKMSDSELELMSNLDEFLLSRSFWSAGSCILSVWVRCGLESKEEVVVDLFLDFLQN